MCGHGIAKCKLIKSGILLFRFCVQLCTFYVPCFESGMFPKGLGFLMYFPAYGSVDPLGSEPHDWLAPALACPRVEKAVISAPGAMD